MITGLLFCSLVFENNFKFKCQFLVFLCHFRNTYFRNTLYLLSFREVSVLYIPSFLNFVNLGVIFVPVIILIVNIIY